MTKRISHRRKQKVTRPIKASNKKRVGRRKK